MPLFEYKAVTPSGQMITEIFEAPNEQSVTQEIFNKGFRPISVVRKKEMKEGEASTLFQKKIKMEEIIMFTRPYEQIVAGDRHKA